MAAMLALASRRVVAVAAATSGVRTLATGTVKWFNPSKGFGFITPDDKAQPDIFAHHTAVQSNGFRFLNEGEKVTFDVQKTDRGAQAVNITDGEGKPFVRPERGAGVGSLGGAPRGGAGGAGGRPRGERRPRSPSAGSA